MSTSVEDVVAGGPCRAVAGELIHLALKPAAHRVGLTGDRGFEAMRQAQVIVGG